jgi:hypothetical protein
MYDRDLLIQLFQEVENQQNRAAYDSGPRAHGRLGYVRDGDTWYPAFIKQREKWHGGYGESGNDIDLIYGKNLSWRLLDNGEPTPAFAGWHKTMHVSAEDAEVNQHPSGVDGFGNAFFGYVGNSNRCTFPGQVEGEGATHAASCSGDDGVDGGKLHWDLQDWDPALAGSGRLGSGQSWKSFQRGCRI